MKKGFVECPHCGFNEFRRRSYDVRESVVKISASNKSFLDEFVAGFADDELINSRYRYWCRKCGEEATRVVE